MCFCRSRCVRRCRRTRPAVDVEGDSDQGPQLAVVRTGEGVHHALLERVDPLGRYPEALLQAHGLDRWVHLSAPVPLTQGDARRLGASLRSTRRPRARSVRGADGAPTADGGGGSGPRLRRTTANSIPCRAAASMSKPSAKKLPAGEDQGRGTRPGSRRACGSSTWAASSSRAHSEAEVLGLALLDQGGTIVVHSS